jgi:hypothetical protein
MDFFFYKIGQQESLTGSAWGGGEFGTRVRGGVAINVKADAYGMNNVYKCM